MTGEPEHQGAGGSERWFRNLLTSISDTVTLVDRDLRVLYTTGAVNGVLGYPTDFWQGVLPFDAVHPDDLPRVLADWERSLASPGVEVSSESRMRAADGSWHDISITGVNLLDDPEVGGVVITTRNITALRQAERLASSQAAVLERVARGAPTTEIAGDCIELMHRNGLRGIASIYLLEGDRLELRAGDAPRSVRDWVREPVRDPARSLCDRAMATETPVVIVDLGMAELDEGLRAIVAAEGIRSAWSVPIASISSGRPVGSLSILAEEAVEPTAHERQVADVAASLVAIAVERERNESQLAHQALHDALTGLPNRALLLDRTDHALARREATGASLALLFCDVDRFKVINDSLGHNVGDQLLVAFADRLRAVVSPTDTVARFGGDEFVVLLEEVAGPEEPVRLAEQLAAALEEPFVLAGGKEVYLTASIGLAMADDHAAGDEWLRDADAAMYRAKDEGRNRLVLFDTQMRDAALRRLQVEHDLRRAVARDELVVHYQPVIDLDRGSIVGAEALVRWQHPERGLLSPAEFVAVAEDIGTIGELGRHVLDVALRELSSLEVVDPATFHLGVNVSARQVSEPDLDQMVGAALERHGWPPSSLLLEVTESALVEVDHPVEALARLQELGVQLAIDDFGTGHSSLARLGRLPVDWVKVDQSFVGALDGPDRRLGRIVDAVIALAGALDLGTSAEGVETHAQLDELRRKRCHLAQGYLFSKPVPLDELRDLLASDPRW
ncbi:MAG TPA: EAL domain-containing protein [Aquihabitans sp.]|nr:EAL domain-containing protein [Aquihabitans sp.]